jgi:Leucine-rich repeat (LRR) protein
MDISKINKIMKKRLNEGFFGNIQEEEEFDIKSKLTSLLKSGTLDNLELAMGISEGLGINFEVLLEEVFDLSFWIKNDWKYDDTSKDKIEIITDLLTKSSIDISLKSLVKIPPSIGYFKNIVEADLHGNELENIPPTIGNLNRLENLWVDSNRLISLPNEICNLENLKLLQVNNNLISRLPDNIGNLQKLEIFWADLNYLQYIPTSFFKLKNLKDVQLNFNEFKKSEIEKLNLFLDANNIEHDLQNLS